MGQNQFDKQIKDRLQFHESEVSSGLWENIESQLHDQGKRRLAPLYLITAVGSIFYFLELRYIGLTNQSLHNRIK